MNNENHIFRTIEVSGEELKFMHQNAPKAFSRTIADALKAEGYEVDRVKVHQELHTIKDRYDLKIIEKARELLKALQKLEFQYR